MNNEQLAMKDILTTTDGNELYAAIREVLQKARQNIARNVNSVIVQAYWQVGRHIVEYEQNGEQRAKYGNATLKQLSEKLSTEFGSGFTVTNLKLMRQFYLAFPIGHALRDEFRLFHYNRI